MAESITFEGGSGESQEQAIVIRGAADELAGVQAEYQYLERLLGRRGLRWRLERQSLVHEQGRSYDRMEVKLWNGASQTIIFDITDFYGK